MSATGSPSALVVLANLDALRPPLTAFVGGSAYPIVAGSSPIVADGLGGAYYGPADEMKSSVSNVGDPDLQALTNVLAPAVVSALASASGAYDTGNAYGADEPPTLTWAKKVTAPSANAVTTWAAARTMRGHMQVRIPKKTADWTASAPWFITDAYYARYVGYVFRVTFDSDCKKSAYSKLEASTPTSAALGDFLVRAGAKLEVDAIAMGPEAEVKAALSSTKCATDHVDECTKLLDTLAAIAANVGSPATPATFDARVDGNGGWFADFFVVEKNYQ
jgi:hypothetical protein